MAVLGVRRTRRTASPTGTGATSSSSQRLGLGSGTWMAQAVLCAGIFPNIARRRGGSDFYEAQNGKVEAGRPGAGLKR